MFSIYPLCLQKQSRVACALSGGHYKRAEASGDRIITQNDCLILQKRPKYNGETIEEYNMDAMNQQQQTVREAKRLAANREELVERIAQAVREDRTAQPLP